MSRGCVSQLPKTHGKWLHVSPGSCLGERGHCCRDAVGFIATFWDLLASLSHDTETAEFLSMNVCNILVPGSGSVPGCSHVPDPPRAAPACRQVLVEPWGHACVFTSPGFCQASLLAPLRLDLMHLTRFGAWVVFVGISPLKKKGGGKKKKVCKETHASSVYRKVQAFCMLAKGVHTWVEVEFWGWCCSREGGKVVGESSHV